MQEPTDAPAPDIDTIRKNLRDDYLRELTDQVDVISFSRGCGFEPSDYQAEVLTSRADRMIFLWGRRCGKTATCAILALWTVLFKSGTVIIVSPTLNQSKEMISEVQFWFKNYQLNHPQSRYVVTEREKADEIKFKYGGRIICRPASSSSIRGYGAHLIIIDEAAQVPDKLIKQDITPILATTEGRIIMISTPYSIGTAFHDACQRPEVWELHGPVKTERCPRVRPSFLATEREWMPADYFRQEYEAEWITSLSNVFPKEQLDRAMMGYTPRTTSNVVVGADFAKINDFTVFTALNEKGEVIGLDESQRLPYPVIVERLKTFCEHHKATKCTVDQTGVGEAVVDDMMRSKLPCPVEGIVLSHLTKTNLINNLRNAFEKERIRIPGFGLHALARKEYTQLLMYRYEELPGSGLLRTSAPEGEHDDYVISLALASWAQRPGGRVLLLQGLDDY